MVFMVAIQRFAKADLYLSEVYPPKGFSYHLLTEYHHQYLKERVFNNLLSNGENREHLKILRNDDCVTIKFRTHEQTSKE